MPRPNGQNPATPIQLAGLVVDIDEQPLAGAAVTLYRGDSTTATAATTTDERGEFAFEVPRDGGRRSRLVVSKPGHKDLVGWHHDREAGGQALSFAFTSTVSITGQVTDTHGDPIPEVAVRMSYEQAITDRDGRYTLELQPGRHHFNVWRNGYQMVVLERLVESDTTLDLVLEPANGRWIRIRIEREGAYLPTKYTLFSYYPPSLHIEGTIDETDEVTLAGLPTNLELSAGIWCDGMCPDPINQMLAPDPRPGRIDWVTTFRPYPERIVRGRVLDEQDAPVAGHVVLVHETFGPDHRLTTDADGQFEFVCRTPDDNHIIITLGDGPRVVDERDPDATRSLHCRHMLYRYAPIRDEIVIHSAAAAGVTGRCVTADGAPLAGAMATLFLHWQTLRGPHTSRILTTDTDATGRFAFAGLNADIGGGVFVAVEKHELRGMSPRFGLTAGRPTELEPVVAQRPQRARGTLRLRSGEPSPWMVVSARAHDHLDWGGRGALSDATGAFEFTVRPGRYDLCVGWRDVDTLLTEFEAPVDADVDLGDITVPD